VKGLGTRTYKIRGTPHTYTSTVTAGGAGEPTLSAGEPGDLFVQVNRDGSVENWVLEGAGEWVRAEAGHPHPRLPGYVLSTQAKGRGSWVTSKSSRTYRYRSGKTPAQREKHTQDREGAALPT